MHLKLINGVPERYSLAKLRVDYNTVSFPKQLSEEILVSYDIYPYTRPDVPSYDSLTQNLTDGDFIQDANGNWILEWKVENLDLDQASGNVRMRRDELISRTDWRFRSDMNPSQEWIDYCQALRDIPSQEGFPYNIVWPTEPSA